MTKKSNDLTISEEQHEVFLGILFGDGHLELAKNKKSARFRIEQSKEKKVYVEHLHSIFQNWNLEAILSNRNNLLFSTKSSTSLLEYHQRFYPAKKCIPKDIGNEFTARSLTYLFMDDGDIKSKDSKGVYINTYCFPKDQQEFFCEIILTKLSLQSSVVFDGPYPRIYISGYSYENLVALLEPYILPFFSYKIPPPRSKKSRFKKE